MAGLKRGSPFRSPRNALQPPQRSMTSQPKISRQSASGMPPTMPIKTMKNQTRGPVPKGSEGEDASPRYKIQVDGAERRGQPQRGAAAATSAKRRSITRMRQMVEVAKTIDQRGVGGPAGARGLHPALPAPGAGVRRADPQGARLGAALQARPGRRPHARNNYKARLRHAQRHPPAARPGAAGGLQRPRPAHRLLRARRVRQVPLQEQARQPDRGRRRHRRDAQDRDASHGFSEDEIGTTYDERMLSILNKAAKYDKMSPTSPSRSSRSAAARSSQDRPRASATAPRAA